MGFPALCVDNPLLVKELRSRMRGAKAYWLLFGYVALLGLAVTIAYFSWWQSRRYGAESFVVGRVFFQTLFSVQVGLVCLVAPGLTAGCITIEKEQRTYDLLAGSPMSARRIVIGKLLSATSFVLLLTISSLPLVSVSFLLGGVSPGEVLSSYLVLILTAFLYASIGLAWSSVARNTVTATIMTYISVLVVFWTTLIPSSTGMDPGGYGILSAVNPIGALMAGLNPEQYFAFTVPAWIPALIVNLLAGILLATIAVRRFDSYSPDDSPAVRIEGLLLYSAVLFFICGGLFRTPEAGVPVSWQADPDAPSVYWSIVLTVLLIAIPIFATGDRAGGTLFGLLARGWKAVFRPRVESSLAFTMLLGASALVIFLLGFPMGRIRMPAEIWVGLYICVTVIVVTVVAWNLVAILISRALKSRWFAFACTFLAMTFLMLLPLTTLIDYGSVPDAQRFHPFRLTVYLNPHIALGSVMSENTQEVPDPSGRGIPFAFVTIMAYAVIACAAGLKLRHTPPAPPQPLDADP